MPLKTATTLILTVLLTLAAVAGVQPRGRADAIEELLFDLHLVPLDGRAPSPFTLKTLDGQDVSLAGLRGRAVLIYYWATW